eukprot:TRINITY_DN9_c4_g1_i1.p1 TRINITY_DN9_c4_g1~~TRINITY_DN9_c4_g1_i1.p1  ORF type:complete len:141 (-),score=12.26 TRINITY_DN9_c4_g1_i1:615-1037(-)
MLKSKPRGEDRKRNTGTNLLSTQPHDPDVHTYSTIMAAPQLFIYESIRCCKKMCILFSRMAIRICGDGLAVAEPLNERLLLCLHPQQTLVLHVVAIQLRHLLLDEDLQRHSLARAMLSFAVHLVEQCERRHEREKERGDG